jgi:formylmethanofuran dehydrogenase subunit C
MTERKAIKEIKKKALTRQLVGALMIAGAIAAGTASNSNSTIALQTGLILIGGQVIIDGFNVSKEAEIHEAAIRELSDSFSGEMKPVVMEFEGRQYKLTGSAEEQFKQWRELLRKIYFAETGFETDQTPDSSESGREEDP